MIDEEITLKKLEVFLAFMRLHSLARVSEELDTRAIFCGALDALTFRAPFRRRAILG